ncbi:MAG: SH3 domain-containing protein [Caldilineaceae bacterium]
MNISIQKIRFLGCQSLLLTLLLLLSACSFARQTAGPAAENYVPIRSPYPTFTPTPALAVPDLPTPTAVAAAPDNSSSNADVAPPPTETLVPTEAPTAEPTQTATLAPPRLVVNSPLVNVRAGPGTNYPVITTVERGQEFDVIGKNAAGDWWRFCCVNEEPAWLVGELVDVDGAVDTVPVSDAVVQVPPTDTPPPAAPAAPTEPPPTEAPPPPSFSFELSEQAQFPEPKLVRVFLYVFDGSSALAGYSVRVKKDGAELPVSAKSQGGQPGMTWPINDSRQRFQNMKVEFPGVAPAGQWEVQLIDGGGNPVGPPANFNLAANDSNLELYVRYKKI